MHTSVDTYFNGREYTIATMHGKEQAIAPVLERAFGMKYTPVTALDTDRWGTFSGEVERTLTPLEALQAKADAANKLSGVAVVVASEGSFGPHPHMFFAAADDELLLLRDYANDLEIVARVLSTNTNYAMADCDSWQAVAEFAKNAGFPEHALIARSSRDDHSQMLKGISDWETLQHKCEHVLAVSGTVYLETDMRAMYNPSRMKVIAETTEKLAALMSSRCPTCNTPGFGQVDFITGLPCSLCGAPTRSVLYSVWRCQKCSHEDKRPPLSGKTAEDPMYCDYCNP